MDRGIRNEGNRRDFRRIGRKALASGRTLALLEARIKPASKKRAQVLSRYTFKRWHVAIPATVLVLVFGIWGAQSFVHSQQIAKAKAASDAATERARSVSKQEEACRQSKVKENAAKVATMTYDQLYGSSCDF